VELKLNRKDQLPIHAQLKAQLVYLIRSAELQPGAQLPTVRQLAGFLRVNRNTVSRVFSEMEKEGYLSCEPGRGTFVAEKKKESKMRLDRMDKLLAIVDESVDRARQLGFTSEELYSILYARVQTTPVTSKLARIRALFLECNRPQTEALSGELESELPLRIDPMLVVDFKRMLVRSRESLNRYALIITTFYHIQEVQALLTGTGIEAVGLMVNTSLEALMRLTALPEGTKVGVACVDRTGSENMRLSIERAGLKHLKLILGYGSDKESLRRMLKEVSVVVCSTLLEGKIRTMAPADKEIIVDERGLDAAGIEMLRSRLQALSTKSDKTETLRPKSHVKRFQGSSVKPM
jgi:GntR family transcriptional regulator